MTNTIVNLPICHLIIILICVQNILKLFLVLKVQFVFKLNF